MFGAAERAVYPAHPFHSSTNYFPDTELRDYWLMVTWRAGVANTVGTAGSAWDLVYRAALDGGALDAAARSTLAALDLLDDGGQLHVPVLRHGDALHDLLQSTVRRYISLLEQQMPLDDLVALSRTDRQHAFAMAYHDVSWRVLDRLIRAGRLAVPTALEPGSPASPASLRGVTALTPVYPPFADLIRAAIEAQ